MPSTLMRFIRSRRFTNSLALVLVLALIFPLLWPNDSNAAVESRPMTAFGPVKQTDGALAIEGATDSATAGLHITLSEGNQQTQTVESVPVAPAQPLASDVTAQLLDRLPQVAVEKTDQQAFNLPEEVLPPPRPGSTVGETFPTTATVTATATVAGGPLEVLRFAPEGEIPVAPFLNVTFNQPMVALDTLESLSTQDVPVQITPPLTGTWKWLGTKTLSFEYSSEEFDRFPMATEYTVEIPAGTQSATGGVLAEAVTWTFTTPPPTIQATYPNYGPVRTDPLLFVSFDQGIDAAAVLETIKVTAGGEEFPVRLANSEEVATDTNVQNLVKNSREGRWLALRAEQPFPTDTTVTVNIGPGTPSVEGPLTTTEVQSFSFTTYAALRIDEYGCGYGSDPCPPFSQFYIRFNNPINEQLFDPALITIEPAVPDVIIELFGNTINIRGATQGRTTYQVTVSAAIEDVFGQKLGEDQVLTFETGPAERYLTGPNAFVTLDPSAAKPVFTVYSVNYDNLRVRAYAVTPQDWPVYQEFLSNNYYGNPNPPTPPGEEVLSATVAVAADPDSLTETAIDLSDLLPNGFGHLIVLVDAPPLPLLGQRDPAVVQAWVQATQIGLDAFVDQSRMLAWATALQDGAPLADVELSLLGSESVTVTNANGTAQWDLPDIITSVLVGRKGNDTAILPQSSYYGGGWQRQSLSNEVRWYVFDDRQMYRPGEEVHVKGWLRRIGNQPDGDVALLGDSNVSVQYQAVDPQGNEITNGLTDVNSLGGFDLVFTIPTNSNLGYASINLSANNITGVDYAQYYHNFQIQEFRRPEFEVTARNEEQGPFFVGDDAVVSVAAAYFAGGPLPNAATAWTVNVSPGTYAPPGWPDFTFGKWTPWWYFSGYNEVGYPGGNTTVSYAGKTDPSGAHYLRLGFDSIDEPQPYSVFAQASVMDVNRQAWAASTSLLVHPADLYVGIHSERTFVEQGTPLEIETIVTDLDGNAVVSQTINLRAVRLDWKYEKGEWKQIEADEQTCTVPSAAEPVVCTFETNSGGQYQITAHITDEQGRANQSQFTRWVSGGSTQRPARNVEQEEVTLIPDKESYQPGDVAEILVQSPFGPAEGLLTVTRSGILYTEHFTITNGAYTLKVPIEEAQIPNINLQVDLVGAAARLDDNGNPVEGIADRPAYATGSLVLSIPPLSRTLHLDVMPAATQLEPGVETTLAVTLTNALSGPVAGGELAIVVVDEAILALTNYQLSDPVATFYSQRGSNLSSYYSPRQHRAG